MGYHDLHFRINYSLCIININYELVYSSSYEFSRIYEKNSSYWLANSELGHSMEMSIFMSLGFTEILHLKKKHFRVTIFYILK